MPFLRRAAMTTDHVAELMSNDVFLMPLTRPLLMNDVVGVTKPEPQAAGIGCVQGHRNDMHLPASICRDMATQLVDIAVARRVQVGEDVSA